MQKLITILTSRKFWIFLVTALLADRGVITGEQYIVIASITLGVQGVLDHKYNT